MAIIREAERQRRRLAGACHSSARRRTTAAAAAASSQQLVRGSAAGPSMMCASWPPHCRGARRQQRRRQMDGDDLLLPGQRGAAAQRAARRTGAPSLGVAQRSQPHAAPAGRSSSGRSCDQLVSRAPRGQAPISARRRPFLVALLLGQLAAFCLSTPPAAHCLIAPLALAKSSNVARRHSHQLAAANGTQQVEARQRLASQAETANEPRAAHWSMPNRPSFFNIIRFPNEECFDSSNQSGTCYTAFECKLLGGQPSSPCAAGFGSCCIVSRTCHVTTREKVVYFKNPSYPAADSDEKFCDLTVEMGDFNVCQLRLDFLDFQLDPPTNGACKDDYLEISASGMPPQTIPRLCGLNRNQHIYINLPQDLSERSASIVFYTDPVGDHRWQVKVTQIDCNQYRPLDWKRHYAKFASSPLWNAHPNLNGAQLNRLGSTKYSTTFVSGFQTVSQTASALAYELLKPQFTPRAPMGCLQYFSQPSGIIESFNFGQYLNNMDYSICIQRQPDTCRVLFTSSDYDWSLNGVGISGASSGVGDQDCARDYLLIPGASRTGDGFTYDRYCGGRLHYYRGQALSAPLVIKTSGPIVLRFHSDAHFEAANNGGFRLQYDQSTQDCIYHTAEEAGSLASQQLIASTLADSRPLGAASYLATGGEAPVLYASQQLGPAPSVQQLAHSDHSQQAGELANSSAFDLLQVPNYLNQMMKRRQDNQESQLWPGGQQAGQPPDRRQDTRASALPADLTKAFDLITQRSGAGWRSLAGRL